jgi:RNA polymerase sigma-70 factor, ECF subfamily
MESREFRVLFKRRVEEKEFETAALPYLHDLYRTALRVLSNARDAEDLVQETYLQAWKSFHRFEPGTNCRAWLFKILFHRIHHHRRKWFNSGAVKESDEILAETLAYEPPIPEQLADEEVLAALERIPPDFRAVVLLADVEHKCHVNQREFVHLILKNQEKILSLAVTRKGADSFARKKLVAALKSSGIPLYNGLVDRYQVAGFESRDHLVFLVSDLGEGENLRLASSLAAPVREFLTRSRI